MGRITRSQFVVSLLGICVSAIVVCLFIRKFNIHGIMLPYHRFSAVTMILGVSCLWLATLCRGIGWKRILRPSSGKGPTVMESTNIVGVSSLLNMIIPARAGDIYRVVMMKRASVPYANVIASLLIEKIFDVIVLVGLGVVLFGVQVVSVHLPQRVLLTLLGVIIFLAVIASSASPIRRLTSQIWNTVMGKLSLTTISPSDLVVFAVFILFYWTCSYVGLMCFVRVLSSEISMLTVLMVLVSTNLGMVVPSAPGGIGVYEYAMTYTLLRAGVQESLAGNISISAHAYQYMAYGIIGITSLCGQMLTIKMHKQNMVGQDSSTQQLGLNLENR